MAQMSRHIGFYRRKKRKKWRARLSDSYALTGIRTRVTRFLLFRERFCASRRKRVHRQSRMLTTTPSRHCQQAKLLARWRNACSGMRTIAEAICADSRAEARLDRKMQSILRV